MFFLPEFMSFCSIPFCHYVSIRLNNRNYPLSKFFWNIIVNKASATCRMRFALISRRKKQVWLASSIKSDINEIGKNYRGMVADKGCYPRSFSKRYCLAKCSQKNEHRRDKSRECYNVDKIARIQTTAVNQGVNMGKKEEDTFSSLCY